MSLALSQDLGVLTLLFEDHALAFPFQSLQTFPGESVSGQRKSFQVLDLTGLGEFCL